MKFSTLSALTLCVLLLFSSCTKSPAPLEQAQKFTAPDFDYKNATEVLVAKNDPASGDRWATRIERNGAPSSENENDWTIRLGPDEARDGDAKAHGLFLLHILDTIKTLQLKDPGVSGTPESFGLNPPLFSIRWKIQTAAAPVEYELKLGSAVKNEAGGFDGLYALLSNYPDHVLVANGALLEMLNRVTSFQVLRLPTLATFTSDDVDELLIGKKFYAQREGAIWTDKKHRPLKNDIQEFLDQATHLRILRFVDDVREQTELQSALSTPTTPTLTFKSRQGSPTVIRLAKQGSRLFATISSRSAHGDSAAPLSVFEIYPEFWAEIQKRVTL